MIVSLKDVVKRYEQQLVLDFVNITILPGEIIGLLGPNGAGKTTTIRAIMNLIPIDGGQIHVFNQPVNSQSNEIKRRIGMVPQEIVVFNDLTALENLNVFGRLYGLKGQELKKKVDETLEFIGLTEQKNMLPKKFSGGMKRRLNIGCAIVHEPELLIMDEPTVGIDPQSRNHILESVRELARRRTTIIYTSHYMEEVQELCSRIVIMDKGRVISEGTLDKLISTLLYEERTILEVENSSFALIERLRVLPGVKECEVTEKKITVISQPDATKLGEIIECARPFGLLAVFSKRPTLEDVFLTLTGKKLRDGEE